MIYRLRCFFDAGSGVCLWAGNDAARTRYGYPVALGALPLTPETHRAGEGLIQRYDTSLDWSDPGGPSPWSASDAAAFDAAASAWLATLRAELAPSHVITDERPPRV